MPAKKAKKKSTKKPSAKQLAARRKKFAAAAKVKNSLGSEAYIQAKKYPDGRYRLFYRGTRNEVFPGRFFKSAKEARQYFLTQKAKENPNRRNSKTIIVKPRKITLIQVGKLVRRKVRNGYVDLVIRGQATKTPQGWLVGKKTIPQGRGIATISSGYYLDKATGTVFAKRARNISQGFYDGSGVFHPIRSSSDYDPGTAGETGKKPIRTRSKKRKAIVKKASQTARDKAATKSRKKTTSRLASRSLQRSVPLKAGSKTKRNPSQSQSDFYCEKIKRRIHDLEARHLPAARELLRLAQAKLARLRKDKRTERWEIKNQLGTVDYYRKSLKQLIDQINEEKRVLKKRNPSPAANRREFAGRYTGDKDLYFPQGTPTGLSKLGKLILIKTQSGTIAPVKGTVWLCRDTKGKLHLGTTSNAPLTDMPAGSLGEVKRLEYEESKPHLGHPNPTIWFHRMGEETGERPTLYSDGQGGLKFRGGRYRITSRGIEN